MASTSTLRLRSFSKTLTWRTVATLDTFVISYFITGSVSWAGSIAGIEVATKVVFYYLHERLWESSSWGLS
ncbi:MAG TPA: DUF2061 domain-containing protein [Sneathiellales bacterium]|nr:DUF2061 domain-containing protein [Sneathiellales bacterium]